MVFASPLESTRARHVFSRKEKSSTLATNPPRSSRTMQKTKCPMEWNRRAFYFGDVLLIRSLPLAHPSGFPSISLVPTARFSSAHGHARAGRTAQKIKTPLQIQWGLYSGDVLLSRGLSPYYHRGCSVSLPCSEWERVVPLRYCHQNSAPIVDAEFW